MHLDDTTQALSVLTAIVVAGAMISPITAMRSRFIIGVSRFGEPKENHCVHNDVGGA